MSLLKKHLPGVDPGDKLCEEKSKLINKIMQIVSSDKRRQNYSLMSNYYKSLLKKKEYASCARKWCILIHRWIGNTKNFVTTFFINCSFK